MCVFGPNGAQRSNSCFINTHSSGRPQFSPERVTAPGRDSRPQTRTTCLWDLWPTKHFAPGPELVRAGASTSRCTVLLSAASPGAGTPLGYPKLTEPSGVFLLKRPGQWTNIGLKSTHENCQNCQKLAFLNVCLHF